MKYIPRTASGHYDFPQQVLPSKLDACANVTTCCSVGEGSIAHVQYIKILAWLRGFLWSFFYIWFGFLCAQVSSGNCETMESWKLCNFDSKIKPRSRVRISRMLIYRTWANWHICQYQSNNIILVCFVNYRFTILPSEGKVVSMFSRISTFHKEFMDKYRWREAERIYPNLYLYVVAIFLSQLIFIFPWFWGMVMYANGLKHRKNKN